MRATWLGVGAAVLLLWPGLGLASGQPEQSAPADSAPAKEPAAPPAAVVAPDRMSSADVLLARGLALFKQRQYAGAVRELTAARQAPDLSGAHLQHVLLLLGISYYRLDQLDRAEELLRQAARGEDPQTRDSARVFLGMVFADQGAPDRARNEFDNAAGSPYVRDAAERLLQRSRPNRLQLTLLVSPEYDGNVPLTPLNVDSICPPTSLPPPSNAISCSASFPAWRSNPQASMDGDVLLLASIAVRPRANGLVISNTFSYRQQFNLTDYNLLLNSTALGYSYFGPADRLRLLGSFNFAMLGGDPLFLDGSGKVAYRRRLVGKLGLSATYDVRYRGYLNPAYYALTGLTQSLRADLDWGLFPQPISFGLGYQAIREQTQIPDPADPAQDFRAWAHGPSLWLRARLHKRVELALASTLLQRVFDSGRVDYGSYSDWSLNVSLSSWLSTFVGGSVIYNSSTDPLFDYLKPTVSAGLSAYLGFL